MAHAEQIGHFVLSNRVPMFAELREFAAAGGLASYGASRPDMWCFSSTANSRNIILASTRGGKRPACFVFAPCAHFTVSIPFCLPYEPVRMRPSKSIDTSFQMRRLPFAYRDFYRRLYQPRMGGDPIESFFL